MLGAFKNTTYFLHFLVEPNRLLRSVVKEPSLVLQVQEENCTVDHEIFQNGTESQITEIYQLLFSILSIV